MRDVSVRHLLEVLEDVVFRLERAVDVLGVVRELEVAGPREAPLARREVPGERAHQRRLPLAVVAEDRDPLPPLDVEVDVAGDLLLGIADGEAVAVQRRPRARLDGRELHPNRAFGVGHRDLALVQAIELLDLGLGLRSRACADAVLVDEGLELPGLRLDDLVVLEGQVELLVLVGEVRLDVPRIEVQLAAPDLQRLLARTKEELAVVGDDDVPAAEVAQEVLEEDEGAQVEEVRGLVEDEEVGVAQEHGRQLDAGLVASRELSHPRLQVGRTELEASGDLAAAPLLLLRVPLEEGEGGLVQAEGVLLLEVAQPEGVGVDDAPAVGLLLAGDETGERRLPGAVRADHADLLAVVKRARRGLEEDLRAVVLGDALELDQGLRHGGILSRKARVVSRS